jgi:hypothetical protein
VITIRELGDVTGYLSKLRKKNLPKRARTASYQNGNVKKKRIGWQFLFEGGDDSIEIYKN